MDPVTTLKFGLRCWAASWRRGGGRIKAALPAAWLIAVLGLPVAASAQPLPTASPALRAPSVQSSAAGTTVFGGVNTSKGPVFIELAKKGRQLKRVVTAAHLTCMPDGDEETWLDDWSDVSVSARGSFKTSYSDTDPLTEGYTFMYSDSLRGKVNRAQTKITGTFRITTVIRRPDGSEMDRCESGDVRFTATR